MKKKKINCLSCPLAEDAKRDKTSPYLDKVCLMSGRTVMRKLKKQSSDTLGYYKKNYFRQVPVVMCPVAPEK